LTRGKTNDGIEASIFKFLSIKKINQHLGVLAWKLVSSTINWDVV